METGYILREEVFESLFEFLPKYELQSNKTLRIAPVYYSSAWEGRSAVYEIDSDLLMLQIELQPENCL
ncbi:MAG: hypothetical protein LIP01_01570 [Tannerellaceae bacterium]|nr:hypothetical protein [Tannerellaceae bacterium]